MNLRKDHYKLFFSFYYEMQFLNELYKYVFVVFLSTKTESAKQVFNQMPRHLVEIVTQIIIIIKLFIRQSFFQ